MGCTPGTALGDGSRTRGVECSGGSDAVVELY
jgi:hypothetical protein